MDTPILTAESLVKKFGGLIAINGVTLSIKKGEMVGLIGPNGSGKTTLFNILTGIYKPDSGKVFFNSERIDGLQPHQIYHKGLVRTFQTPRILQRMTVLDNLLISVKNPGDKFLPALFKRRSWLKFENDIRDKALEILEFLGLEKYCYTPAAELSGGQMKLLEIARALISEPSMILLDEPTAGVNPVLANDIYVKLREIKENMDITLFIVEHRIELLMGYVDKVHVMHRGKIIAEGRPDDVINDEDVIKVYLGYV